jgi:hypothetical protein
MTDTKTEALKVEALIGRLFAYRDASKMAVPICIEAADTLAAAIKEDRTGGASDVEGLYEMLLAFEDFINSPPQYEDQRMVRDYRHELYRKWEPLCRAILPFAKRNPGASK